MKRATMLLAAASLTFMGCGSDSDGGSDGGETQSELADLLVQDSAGLFDEECVRDKTDELSDEDAQFLIDNFDATDTDAFAPELETWVGGLIDCFSEAESAP